MKEEVFWLGTSTFEIPYILKNGISYDHSLICRSGGNLRIGKEIAYRILKNAYEDAIHKSNQEEGSQPAILCLRLPEGAADKIAVPVDYRAFPIKSDPIEALMAFHTGSKEPAAFQIFKERLRPFLLIDQTTEELARYERVFRLMFQSAARFELSKDKEWEVLVRQVLSDAFNDTAWMLRDSGTNRFVKPLPAIFQCDTIRDKRAVDHMAKVLTDMSSGSGARQPIKFRVSDSIKPLETNSLPRIDFIFAIEASWNINVNKNGRMVSVTQYQLGTHFGATCSHFFKAWQADFGQIENIVWQNRRFSEVNANFADKLRG